MFCPGKMFTCAVADTGCSSVRHTAHKIKSKKVLRSVRWIMGRFLLSLPTVLPRSGKARRRTHVSELRKHKVSVVRTTPRPSPGYLGRTFMQLSLNEGIGDCRVEG